MILMLLTRLQQPVINLMLVVITRLEMYFHQSSNIILDNYYRALVSGTDPGPWTTKIRNTSFY